MLKNTVIENVKANATQYPTINQNNKQDAVIEYMKDYYQLNKEPCSWEDAAQDVEEYLSLKASQRPQPARQTPQRQVSQTLTNSQNRSLPPTEDNLSLDPDERLRQLLQELKG